MRILLLAILFFTFSEGLLAQSSSEFSILTWNVFLRPRAILWGDGQMKRAKLIAQVIEESKYDVVVLQEAFDKGCVRKMKRSLDAIYPFQMLPSKTRSGKLNNGLWLLSKHPIVARDSIYFLSAAHSDKMAQKGALFARINKDGKQYDVIGTHVQAQEGELYTQIRNEQFQQIRQELIDKHHIRGIALFIAGDLNTPFKDSVNYALMLKYLDAKDGEVQLPKNDEICSEEPETWGCKHNELIPKKYRGQTELLDYILIRNDDGQAKSDRRLEVYRAEQEGRVINLSDHYAIGIHIEN